MVILSRRWATLASISLLTASVATACGTLKIPLLVHPSEADSSTAGQSSAAVVAQPAIVATPTASAARLTGPQPVAVKRGPVTQILSLDGTVVAQSQETITYPIKGIVDSVKVKAGQAVTEGDVLVELDTTDATKVLDAARTTLETAQANLAQAQTQAETHQAALAQQAATDQLRQQQAIQDADAGLRRAQENLATVRAGKTTSVRQAQETAVALGQTQLQTALNAQAALQAGPDDNALRSARRDVANAQIAYNKAQADLDTLTRGPDPGILRGAQATVTHAQTQLQLAQAAKVDPKAADPAVARIQLDGAIQDAQLALQNAESTVAKLKQPPSEVDVQAARQHVQDAEDGLTAATAKEAAFESGPDQAALDAAQGAVDGAQHYLAEAQANLAEVNSHPTPSEMADAQDAVKKAQLALDNASRPGAQPADPAGADITTLQKTVSQDEAAVAAQQQTLDAMHLKAPHDGTVVAIRVKAGDPISSARPVLVLARPGPPIVRVDLDDLSAKQVQKGQSAAIQIGSDTSPAARVPGAIKSVTQASPDGSTTASADVEVNWTDGQTPRYSTPVAALVTVQQKDDVLLVPKSAVRSAAGRSTVEVQDGSLRRLVTVQVGISTDTSVEIVSGLTEGQMVLATAT